MIHRTSHFPFMGFQSQIHCIPISSRKQCFLYWWGAVAAALDTKRKIIFMLWRNLFHAFFLSSIGIAEDAVVKSKCLKQSVTKFFIWKSFAMNLFLSPEQQTPPPNFSPLCPVNSIFYAPTPPSENNMASLDDNN